MKIFLPEFSEKDALPDGAVTKDDLRAWDAEFGNVCEMISPLFHRADSRAHAVRYLRGLLAPLERKNGWTMSEFAGLREPKALQRFLNLTQWDPDKMRDIVRGYAIGHFGDSRGVLIADPTGFAKKGRKSAGVQRQYSGTLGRIDNCQIGTFLAYANTSGDRYVRKLPGQSGRTNGSAAPAASGARDSGFTTGRSSARATRPAST